MRFIHGLRFMSSLVMNRVTCCSHPISVIIALTNRCNCRCRHCYASYFDRSQKDEMGTADVVRLIRDLRTNGCLRISFSGGEPLLREDIGELLQVAAREGISAAVNTNGILVPENLSVLKQADNIVISLDGTVEHHDFVRGEGTGEAALTALAIAASAGINVYTNTVLNRHNLNDVEYILELADKYHYRAEFSLFSSNIYDKQVTEDLKPTTNEFQTVLRKLISLKEAGAPILLSAAAYSSVLDCWKDFDHDTVVGTAPPEGMPDCPAGKFFAAIDANGIMYPCTYLIEKTEALSALSAGVSAAWEVAGRHDCRGCYQPCFHEFSMLMNLSPSVICNYAGRQTSQARYA